MLKGISSQYRTLWGHNSPLYPLHDGDYLNYIGKGKRKKKIKEWKKESMKVGKKEKEKEENRINVIDM